MVGSSGRARSMAAVDLFCGAGGLTHGLFEAGLEVLAGADIAEACRLPYEANHPGIRFHARDVADLDARTLREWFGRSDVRVLVGCPPCQPFSKYRTSCTPDPRENLVEEFGRLVEDLQPDILALENVPQVVRSGAFETFVCLLHVNEYHVWHEDVDVQSFGVAQIRRRHILLASKLGEIELLAPAATPRTVRDVIGNLEPIGHGCTSRADSLHMAAGLSAINLRRIQASKPDGTWRDWPAELRSTCHRKRSGQTYASVYGRMSWDRPAPTITTQFYAYGSGRFGHPEQDRALSLREGALLQGFPADYRFVADGAKVTCRTVGRMIGNAVPVRLGQVIGKSILRHAERHW